MRTNNRWVIAIAGAFFQIALGAVYAWSVFRAPLAKQFAGRGSARAELFPVIFAIASVAIFAKPRD
jgi:MFS transporter, OFA family, oxalate/formate antiporter